MGAMAELGKVSAGNLKELGSETLTLFGNIGEDIKKKLEEFNKKYPNKDNVSLNDLKAVYRRGSGAYSTSHRPNISRAGWSYARTNKFLEKAAGKKVKAAYVQDDDLLKYEEGGLIAANGKKSNLTPEQYELVRTPNFKAWFGDWENEPLRASKVVDENGEPKVVYHGTYVETEFNIFDFYKADLGFHFGTYQQAKNRSETKKGKEGYKSIVLPYFLNSRILFEINDAGEFEYPQSYLEDLLENNIIYSLTTMGTPKGSPFSFIRTLYYFPHLCKVPH
jgi:hypothetical protein